MPVLRLGKLPPNHSGKRKVAKRACLAPRAEPVPQPRYRPFRRTVRLVQWQDPTVSGFLKGHRKLLVFFNSGSYNSYRGE
jgi:hypothetical protein